MKIQFISLLIAGIFTALSPASAQKKNNEPQQKIYDIAAFVWPSYHPDDRARVFWPDGIGEWQTVMSNKAKYPGHEQPRYPLWGYVNEADPYVMEMQIEAATRHGVNVFIYDWYWYDGLPFLEGCLNNGFLGAANNHKMKFYLMWANHDVNATWDKRLAGKPDKSLIWKGGVDRKQFEIVCLRVIEKYFSQPNYYTVNGKPSFMIYDLQSLINGLGGIEETKDALEWFRKQVIKAGYKGLDLQLTLRRSKQSISGIAGDNIGTQKSVIDALKFDGVTHYQYAHILDIDRDYTEIQADAVDVWNELGKEYDIPYYPHVSIGWDNNPRFEMFRPGVVKNNTPANFKKALQDAKTYVDAHPKQAPLITINSWNEWTETSYLQPCTMFGYGYLEAVKEVFK
jgi:hypothetical protein